MELVVASELFFQCTRHRSVGRRLYGVHVIRLRIWHVVHYGAVLVVSECWMCGVSRSVGCVVYLSTCRNEPSTVSFVHL